MAVVSSTGTRGDVKTVFHQETRRAREPWVGNDKLVSDAASTRQLTPNYT